jgi:lipopolysaccharide export system protein LptA
MRALLRGSSAPTWRELLTCMGSIIIFFALGLSPALSLAAPKESKAKEKQVATKQRSKSTNKPAPAARDKKQPDAASKPAAASDLLGLDQSTKKLPTYIKSDQLVVNNKDRTFSYSGNVEVTQGDLMLSAQLLDGTYDEKNQIKDLTARRNVIIVKGEDIRASGEQAVYDKGSETVVLTENPELSQGGSILTADRIRIFLKENRSVAEGQVRVKVAREEGKSGSSPLSLSSVKR